MPIMILQHYHERYMWVQEARWYKYSLLLVVEPDLPDLEMLFSHVCTPDLLYTRSPTLGFGGEAPENFFLGCLLANIFADPWYCVNRSIFPWYFSYKRKHCKNGCVLYCSIVNNLCDCVRETVRAWRGSAAVLMHVVSLHLFGWYNNKGLTIYVWM